MLGLRRYGLSVRAIAQELEVGKSAVHAVCQQARKGAAVARLVVQMQQLSLSIAPPAEQPEGAAAARLEAKCSD